MYYIKQDNSHRKQVELQDLNTGQLVVIDYNSMKDYKNSVFGYSICRFRNTITGKTVAYLKMEKPHRVLYNALKLAGYSVSLTGQNRGIFAILLDNPNFNYALFSNYFLVSDLTNSKFSAYFGSDADYHEVTSNILVLDAVDSLDFCRRVIVFLNEQLPAFKFYEMIPPQNCVKI